MKFSRLSSYIVSPFLVQLSKEQKYLLLLGLLEFHVTKKDSGIFAPINDKEVFVYASYLIFASISHYL